MFLIINGSPRKGENCYSIIENMKKILNKHDIDYEVLNIWDMNMEYCNACGYCEKTGICHIKDDMTNLYSKFDDSTGTIVVSPVYFDSIPAKLKTLVDRTQAFYASKYILKKPSIDRNKHRVGLFVSVGGSKPYETQFIGGEMVVDFFFKSINTKLLNKYYISCCDEKKVKDHVDAIKNIEKLTLNLIKNAQEN